MPNRFQDLVHYDVAGADLVIVLGTSLLGKSVDSYIIYTSLAIISNIYDSGTCCVHSRLGQK